LDIARLNVIIDCTDCRFDFAFGFFAYFAHNKIIA
jgi:hypothetical protein